MNSIEFFMNHISTSLQYAGIEFLMERIIKAYEDSFNIPSEEQTPVFEITRRTLEGIEIFDGAYNVYTLGDFAVEELTYLDGKCELKGFFLNEKRSKSNGNNRKGHEQANALCHHSACTGTDYGGV